VFVVPWNDDPARSLAAVRALFPADDIVIVEKRKLRESPLREQFRMLRQLRGKAVVFCFRSLADLTAPLLLQWVGFLHRCPVTLWLDDAGNKTVHRRWSWLYLTPITLFAIASDACVLLTGLVSLEWGLRSPLRHAPSRTRAAGDGLGYLFPHPLLRARVGGAMSNMQGFLGGLSRCGLSCRVFAAQEL